MIAADNGIFNFFSHSTWMVLRNLLVFIVCVFWLSIAYWVYKDARRRIEDPWLVGMATILGLFPPFIGALVYMLFRPPEYLDDVRERELEIKAMEERLSRRDMHCPVCRADVDPAFLDLPGLHDGLRQSCRTARRRSRRSGRSARTARRPSRPRRVDARPADTDAAETRRSRRT